MQAVLSSVTFSDFRAHASSLLEGVTKGRGVRVLRHGKPLADIVPPQEEIAVNQLPSWKRPIEPLRYERSTSLASAVIAERDKARY